MISLRLSQKDNGILVQLLNEEGHPIQGLILGRGFKLKDKNEIIIEVENVG